VADTPKSSLGVSEDARVQKAMAEFASLLVPGESMEAYAVQRRLFALVHRRSLVCATSGRLIGISRGLFGGFNPETVRWQDIKDVEIKVRIFGADLAVVALSSPDLAVAGQTRVLSFPGLRKEQAEAVYRICQAQEQAWREKRRIRELEELRAKSGGIQLGAAAGAGGASNTASSGDGAAARLQQAKEMFEKGLITDSEYESLKARIVGNL
jgi:putative oligomerization/nucleic acid binding protein